MSGRFLASAAVFAASAFVTFSGLAWAVGAIAGALGAEIRNDGVWWLVVILSAVAGVLGASFVFAAAESDDDYDERTRPPGKGW